MKAKKTDRGFTYYDFEDRYEQKCSLQDSSLATADAIWFGVDNRGPHMKGPDDKFGQDVFARMHLTKEQVKELLPLLQHFVETGFLPRDDD